VGVAEFTGWDEAIEREHEACAEVRELLSGEVSHPVIFDAGSTRQDIKGTAGEVVGRLTRTWTAIEGAIRVRAQRVAGPYGALKLTVRIENHTRSPSSLRDRDDALGYALIAAHALIAVPGGSFLSMIDPPQWASAEVVACVNVGTWPVLAGPPDCRELVLSWPVILYDYHDVAPESAGDLFDATEIDEILTLRTLALTESEKRAARATDPRASALMDRLDVLPPETLDRLHGAIRYLGAAPAGAGGPVSEPRARGPVTPPPSAPWWDPGSDVSVSPYTDRITINGVPIGRGSRVRMRPGSRRADAQDLFLVGREARVEAVLHDVDGKVHVAVSPEHDPAADLQRSYGRFLYFATDEIEPIEPAQGDESEREEDPA